VSAQIQSIPLERAGVPAAPVGKSHINLLNGATTATCNSLNRQEDPHSTRPDRQPPKPPDNRAAADQLVRSALMTPHLGWLLLDREVNLPLDILATNVAISPDAKRMVQ